MCSVTPAWFDPLSDHTTAQYDKLQFMYLTPAFFRAHKHQSWDYGFEVIRLRHGKADVPAFRAAMNKLLIKHDQDPRDALVARDGMVLGELPNGARVGTGSPRRASQLEALGLGLEVVPIRGNVGTRIRKVRDGELDAVVLARAGLARLGRLDEVTEALDPLQMLPAPAQGALAVECRAGDFETEQWLGALNDPGSRAAVTAERAMLAGLGSPCSAPVGALAEVVEDLDDDGGVIEMLSLRGVAATSDGALVRASILGKTTEAESLGRALAAELLDLGAESLPAAGGTTHNPSFGST